MAVAQGRRAAVAAVIALVTLAGPGHAQTAVPCDMAPTTALGDAIAIANPGAILAITGLCQQQVVVASALDWGITITNHTGLVLAALADGDGIEGQIRIAGPIQVAISGITLQGPASDPGYDSVVSVSGGATVSIANARIADGWRVGLLATANASATLSNTEVSGNGRANIAGMSDGVRAMDGARIVLGSAAADGTVAAASAVTIDSNAGNGISALSNSSVFMAGGTVTGNGASQVALEGASAAILLGTQIAQTAPSIWPQNFAIQIMHASKLLLAGGASVAAGTFAGGVLAGSASSFAMTGASVTNSGAAAPSVQATGSSNMILAGGNTVTNGVATGPAMQIDHSASMVQSLGASLAGQFPGAPAAAVPVADTIAGFGYVEDQSSMELGVGLIAGANSLVWTGTMIVTQNSQFRMSGGAAISGTLKLTQASNGFFTVVNGGTNTVSSQISCPWSVVPTSHIAGPTFVSPPPVLATSLASAGKTQCLPF
ncbi:MAG TPA: right-handed parallel beta-helix repeat-containing protein [Stellaceae bacterium]|nr:right-handed parallel beta-helix repeat-containing protein [Stellaceae bacterium]